MSTLTLPDDYVYVYMYMSNINGLVSFCYVTREFELTKPRLDNLSTTIKQALSLVFLFLTSYSSIIPIIKHQQWHHATKEHMSVNKILYCNNTNAHDSALQLRRKVIV